MQSRTHADTAQIILDGIVNSRHICWSHTVKVPRTRVTFVRRNSAAVIALRNIYFDINKLSRIFAVNVHGVSVDQLHWNLINWYIPVCSSFAVVNVVNILNINIMLFVTLTDVLMIDWVLSVCLIHTFIITETTQLCTTELMMRWTEITELMKRYNSWFCPCVVCVRGVGSNSVQCTTGSCHKWVHRKCGGIKGRVYIVMKSFICWGCSNPAVRLNQYRSFKCRYWCQCKFGGGCLQCFDTVGWAAEGHPACKKWGMAEVGTG